MSVIDVQTAEIKTMGVQIRALTIGSKQVTLSVFRQLQNEDLIDEQTGQLRGEIWGRVNYFWGACSSNHLHVVWQQGEELRRACVYHAPAPQHLRLKKPSLEQFLRFEVLDGRRYEMWWNSKTVNVEWDDHFSLDVPLSETVKEYQHELDQLAKLPGSERYYNDYHADKGGYQGELARQRQKVEQARAALLAEVAAAGSKGYAVTREEEEQRLTRRFDAFYAVAERWGESYRACLAAPHLFIAV